MKMRRLIMKICILLSIVCMLTDFNIYGSVLAQESNKEDKNIILEVTSPNQDPIQDKLQIGNIYSKTEIQKMRITIDHKELQQSDYSFSAKDNQREEETNSDYKFPYNLYLHNVDYTSEEHMLQVQVEDVKGVVTELEETILFSNATNAITTEELSEEDAKDESMIIKECSEKESSKINMQNDINGTYTADSPLAKIINLKVVEGGFAGTPYKLTTTAKSTNAVLYQYLIQNVKTKKWTELNKYNSKNSYTWTPNKSGEYRIRVRVKDSDSKRDQDNIKDYFVTVEQPLAKITNLKVINGGFSGKQYQLTTTAKSNNEILYQYLIQNVKTKKWTVLNKYNSENSYTWTPEKAGKYIIRARVIDSYSERVQDSIKDYFVTVQEPIAKITNLKVVEGGYIGKQYQLTTTAKSNNAVLYQYLIQDLETNKWVVLNQYNDNNSCTWTPEKSGKYRIRARIKDSYSERTQDSIRDYIVTVKGNLLLAGKTIMLDPGHGGYDPGAVNGSIYEKNLNNGITKMVANKLISLGANVIYTRNPNTDIYLSLDQRAALANQKMPDLFISVHHDANYVKGYSIHYSSYRPNLETFGAYFKDSIGKTHHIIREVDGNAYYLENGCEKYITVKTTPYTIYDSTPSRAATNSKKFAYALYDSMKQLNFIGPRNNPVTDHNLAITRLTNMPSILIEAGPTNSTSANESNQNAVADKMIDAIKNYFN